jgi:hypothetical protein
MEMYMIKQNRTCFKVIIIIIIIITNKDTDIVSKHYNIRKFTDFGGESFIYMLKSTGPKPHSWGNP